MLVCYVFQLSALFDCVLVAVPVYDACDVDGFDFSYTDLRDVGKLPQFKKGKVDPDGQLYIASVGYTAGSYNYSPSNSGVRDKPAVSLNVMFVVVLGKMETK